MLRQRTARSIDRLETCKLKETITMKPSTTALTLAAAARLLLTAALAQVPGIVTYQGRVTSDGVNFTGSGHFKFALVNADASDPVSYWSNDGSSVAGSESSKD